MTIAPDGKIVLAGTTDVNTPAAFAVARFTAAGTLDTSFDGDGKQAVSFADDVQGLGVVIQPDRKVVVAGYTQGLDYNVALARLEGNTAPALTNVNVSLTAIGEDPASNPGTLVSALVSGATDVNGDTVGMAITGLADLGYGTWQYSLNGGAWTAMPAVSATSALLLRPTDAVRFVPAANYNNDIGPVTTKPSLSLVAWDQVVGTAGTTYNTTLTDNTNAFGLATGTATITVNAVNDAPTVAVPASTLNVAEDIAQAIAGVSIGDVDDVLDPGHARTLTLSVGHGKLTVLTNISGGLGVGDVSGNGTTSVTLTGTIQQINATLAAAGGLMYLADANYFGVEALSALVSDQGFSGTGGALTASATTTMNVVSVNDAPSFTKGRDLSAVTGSGAQAYSGWATGMSAGPANEATQTLSFHVAAADPALFAVQPSVDPVTGTLTFTPAANVTADTPVTINVTLQDSGGILNGGVDSTTQQFTITVTARAVDVYVDDSWAGSTLNAPVGGHTFGVDAFATISAGIQAAATNGTVHVAAGNYVEAVTVNKSVSILGDGLPTVTAPAGTGQGALQCDG